MSSSSECHNLYVDMFLCKSLSPSLLHLEHSPSFEKPKEVWLFTWLYCILFILILLYRKNLCLEHIRWNGWGWLMQNYSLTWALQLSSWWSACLLLKKWSMATLQGTQKEMTLHRATIVPLNTCRMQYMYGRMCIYWCCTVHICLYAWQPTICTFCRYPGI